MPSAIEPPPTVKKLVLCFDGTGNKFTGTTADTNVVKLYNKFDRDTTDQYHYYQTGIGTTDIGANSVNKTAWGRFKSGIAATLDQGFGTTFDAHVIAGYRFIMRYYDTGDKIYMFGFSRGAYTARFLARMINTVGLLSKGNEEMVPFAYELYQRYEQGAYVDKDEDNTATKPDASQKSAAAKVKARDPEREPLVHGSGFDPVPDGMDPQQVRRNELHAFTSTFCRRERTEPKPGETKALYTGVKVYFLGLFDCVGSVAVLETSSPVQPPVLGTADHVRHAVATDERRVKFKASLMAQEPHKSNETLKEVWFPGNHGDIGGGWPAMTPEERKTDRPVSWWQRLVTVLTTRKPKNPPKNVGADPYQMSDIPLGWMLKEIDEVGRMEPRFALKFGEYRKGFDANFKNENAFGSAGHKQALHSWRHDTMKIGWGCSLLKVMFWNFMEYLPLPRYEFVKDRWTQIKFPPNMGGTRDIPRNAEIHQSLIWRMQNKPTGTYEPLNDHGDSHEGRIQPCLKGKTPADLQQVEYDEEDYHNTYTFDHVNLSSENFPTLQEDKKNWRKAYLP